MRLPGEFIFGKSPSVPAAPPPLPTREDPAIAAARRKQRQSELQRRGRAASILTGGAGVLGETPVTRPGARVAQNFGG